VREAQILEVVLICVRVYKVYGRGAEEVTFMYAKKFDNVQEFSDFYFVSRTTRLNNCVFIGHYAGGFDYFFIIRDTVTRLGLKPKIITSGTRYISIVYQKPRVRFLDSFNYLSTSLRKLPAVFGLEARVSKSYFPHLFHSMSTLYYKSDRLPSKECYGYGDMTERERSDFESWYAVRKNEKFDLRKELEHYCSLDVEVLAESILALRRIVSDLVKDIASKVGKTDLARNGLDLFEMGCQTVSSLSIQLFRRIYLKEKSLLHLGGARSHQNVRSSSYVNCIVDMWNYEDYLQQNTPLLQYDNRFISYASSTGEAIVPTTPRNYFIDCYDRETKTVIEFNHCLLSGHDLESCPFTKGKDRNVGIPQSQFAVVGIRRWENDQRALSVLSTLNERLEKTRRRERAISALGFTVRSVWSCEIPRTTFPYIEPLNIKQAVAGGRTESIQRFLSSGAGDSKIMSTDVISMYPAVLMRKTYPISSLRIIRPPLAYEVTTEQLLSCEGVACIDFLAPRTLHLPVLFVHANDRLLFPLCRSCVEEGDLGKEKILAPGTYRVNHAQLCSHHDPKDRFFRGVYALPELRLAVEKGYTILWTHELWHFKETSDSFFLPYLINLFRLKLANSGFPTEVKTETEKEQYAKYVSELNGVVLSTSEIKQCRIA
jgi:hypothetical protein